MSEFALTKEGEEEVAKRIRGDFEHYKKTVSYLGGNVPIQCLCLPVVIENALIADGCLRVYDLFNRDLTKIKGIGKTRVELLTARLDEFFSVCL